jgi:hypothetical protein
MKSRLVSMGPPVGDPARQGRDPDVVTGDEVVM